MSSGRCESCGVGTARYICQECGRGICELCIEPDTWLCPDCYRKRYRELKAEPKEEGFRVPLYIKMLFGGLVLVFIGLIVLALAALLSGSPSSFAFVLMIPPIPIIFGSGEHTLPLLLLTITLAIIWIIFLIIISMRRARF